MMGKGERAKQLAVIKGEESRKMLEDIIMFYETKRRQKTYSTLRYTILVRRGRLQMCLFSRQCFLAKTDAGDFFFLLQAGPTVNGLHARRAAQRRSTLAGKL